MRSITRNGNGVKTGLEGVVAAETRLSHVNGQEGRLTIGGFPLEVLAHQASFEEVVYLLWYGRLPTAVELKAFIVDLAGLRTLPAPHSICWARLRPKPMPPMDALRMAIGTVDLDPTTPNRTTWRVSSWHACR